MESEKEKEAVEKFLHSFIAEYSDIISDWNRIRDRTERVLNSALGLRQTLMQELYPQWMDFSKKYAPLLKEKSVFQASVDTVLKPLARYWNSILKPIEDAAEHYFVVLLTRMGQKIVEMHFTPKVGGVQLGRVLHLI